MEGMNRKTHKGFTLIEAAVFLFIFALITVVFFQVYAYGTALIVQSKNRLGAIALATQKMEIVHSLDYDAIGTTTGIPSGDLVEDETVQVNNSQFHVHTFVQYIDNAYDGTLGGSPNDLIPNDSKRVRIEVGWGGETEAETIALFSTLAPLGIEQSAGGGILSVNILDSEGNGVPSATVAITNSSVAPAVNITTDTDATGNLFLVGAPASSQGYQVTFSKSGYFGSASYAPYPTTSFIPTDVHASVVNGAVNPATFVMDRESTLELVTEDPFGTSLSDVEYHIEGGRQLGSVFGSSPPEPVYGFSDDDSTNSSGEKQYADMSYGTYTWELDASETTYTFVGLDPESGLSAQAIELLPGTTMPVKMILADEAVNGALFTVTSTADGQVINGASVRLSNSGLSYDEEVIANAYGKAYFPKTSTPGLTAATYDVEVNATGYSNYNGTVDITSGLEEVAVNLNPS